MEIRDWSNGVNCGFDYNKSFGKSAEIADRIDCSSIYIKNNFDHILYIYWKTNPDINYHFYLEVFWLFSHRLDSLMQTAVNHCATMFPYIMFLEFSL